MINDNTYSTKFVICDFKSFPHQNTTFNELLQILFYFCKINQAWWTFNSFKLNWITFLRIFLIIHLLNFNFNYLTWLVLSSRNPAFIFYTFKTLKKNLKPKYILFIFQVFSKKLQIMVDPHLGIQLMISQIVWLDNLAWRNVVKWRFVQLMPIIEIMDWWLYP